MVLTLAAVCVSAPAARAESREEPVSHALTLASPHERAAHVGDPDSNAQRWFFLTLGPAVANVLDGRAPGLALRLGVDEQKNVSPHTANGPFFVREVMLFAGRSEGRKVWSATFGPGVRWIHGRLRYGAGAGLGFAVGPNEATGGSGWMLPFFLHGEASVDFLRGERLDGFVEVSAGVGLESFYTASALIGVRLARR